MKCGWRIDTFRRDAALRCIREFILEGNYKLQISQIIETEIESAFQNDTHFENNGKLPSEELGPFYCFHLISAAKRRQIVGGLRPIIGIQQLKLLLLMMNNEGISWIRLPNTFWSGGVTIASLTLI